LAGYVQLRITRLMNSAGLCAALPCSAWSGVVLRVDRCA
jgi:hypothetical protein